MRNSVMILLSMGLFSWAGVCLAGNTYHSPLGATPSGLSGPAVLNVEHHRNSTGIMVTANEPVAEDHYRWVMIPLTLERDYIEEVRVCYQVDTASPGSTYISQIRLSQMNKPIRSSAKHDDTTDLTSTSPRCYRSTLSRRFRVGGTITLHLKIVIGDAEDRIFIGGIRVR